MHVNTVNRFTTCFAKQGNFLPFELVINFVTNQPRKKLGQCLEVGIWPTQCTFLREHSHTFNLKVNKNFNKTHRETLTYLSRSGPDEWAFQLTLCLFQRLVKRGYPGNSRNIINSFYQLRIRFENVAKLDFR